MIEKAHKKYHEGSLTHRDYLAAHRTILANDRTWLSYVRTALTLFIAGVTFIRFFQSEVLTVVGWIFVPAGILFIVIGLWKYHKVRKMIHTMRNDEEAIEDI